MFATARRGLISLLGCILAVPLSAQPNLSCLPATNVDCSTGWLNALPPVAVGHEVFATACRGHDFCYRYGNTTYGKSRYQCDTEFRSRMRDRCSGLSITDLLTLGVSKANCYAGSEVFYNFVRQLGASSFRTGANSNLCEYDGPARPSRCGYTSSAEECWTTNSFSEENGGLGTCGNRAVTGLWCTGNRCDNKYLRCSAVPEDLPTQSTLLARSISEEASRNELRTDVLVPPAIIAGLKCTGAYCDNIQVVARSSQYLGPYGGAP